MDTTKTQQIASALRGSRNVLGNASTKVAAAANHAEQVRTRMLAAGFHGVAAGMTQIISQINNVQAQLNGHSEQVKTAIATVAEITADMSADAVSARLAAVKQTTTSTRTALAATVVTVGQTKTQISTVLRGGQPGPLISMLEEARQAIVHAGISLDASMQRMDEADAEARQAGN